MPSTCVAGTNIYYIDSVSGSDSSTQAQAKRKSTPWKHDPYMVSFTGRYSHTAGDCFVFKGGSSYGAADRVAITAGGSSISLYDYHGVDPTWHNGSSWTRPLFDLQEATKGTKGEYAYVDVQADYVIWDNTELIDASCAPGVTTWILHPHYGTDYINFTNNYIHKFMAPMTGCTSTGFIWAYGHYGVPPGCHGEFDHNIVDGSDGNTGYIDSGAAGYECDAITNNVMYDLCDAVAGADNVVAYNLIYNVNGFGSTYNCFVDGYHIDGIQTDTDSDIHDNVIYNVGAGEVIEISPGANWRGLPYQPWPGGSHIYNNVIWGNGYVPPGTNEGAPTPIEIGTGGDTSPTTGTAAIYNNTIECLYTQYCLVMYISIGNLTIENNHLITKAGNAAYCTDNAPFDCTAEGTFGATTFNYSPSTEVYETERAANNQGYSKLGNPYVYAPTNSSGATVTTAAANLTSLCSGIAYLCVDTEYGVVQSTGNIATAGRTQGSRPATGNWNAGAYTFQSRSSSSSGQPPANIPGFMHVSGLR